MPANLSFLLQIFKRLACPFIFLVIAGGWISESKKEVSLSSFLSRPIHHVFAVEKNSVGKIFFQDTLYFKTDTLINQKRFRIHPWSQQAYKLASAFRISGDTLFEYDLLSQREIIACIFSGNSTFTNSYNLGSESPSDSNAVIYTVTQETLIYKGEKVQTFSVFKDPIRITHKPSFTVTYGSRKKSVYSKEYGLMKQWLWDDAKGDSLYFSRELIAELAPRPLLP